MLMMVALAYKPAPYFGAIFALGVLMAMYFGGRFNIRAFQFLIRLDRRLGENRPAYPLWEPLADWILGIRLKDTAVRDVLGLAAAIAGIFIPMAFW
jgi:hypothetical protein